MAKAPAQAPPKKPTRRPSGRIEALRQSVLWHALQKLASGQTSADARARLSPGAAHEMFITIEALIDGKEYYERHIGELRIGQDNPTNQSSADDEGLVAYLLDQLSAAERERLLVDLPAMFLAHDQSLPVGDERRREAKALRKKLRKLTPATQRGSVTFASAADEAA